MNLILKTDSYKISHPAMWPPNTTSSHYYMEARSDKVYDDLIFFGLQMILKKYFLTPITMRDIVEAKVFSDLHFGHNVFPYSSWKYILDNYDGYIPVNIKAVREGSKIQTGNVLMTVESIDEKCAWVSGWIESLLLRVWYPTLVATKSYNVRKLIDRYLDLSSDSPEEEIWFKLHDFGARACSSSEQAEIGGAAHLLNFKGSDTVEGILAANKYYGNWDDTCPEELVEELSGINMYGNSIPATEHSVTTSFGEKSEFKAYRHFINCYLRENQMLACVIDSYDSFNALNSFWCSNEIVENIKTKDSTIVIRVDSGDPVEEVLSALNILQNTYGYVYNSKGYRVLNNVRVLQGDGIDIDIVEKILQETTKNGFSASNVSFGMGGKLLHPGTRDTLGFAYKLSNLTSGNVNYDVCKSPKTDESKRSKEGRLGLFLDESTGMYETKKLEDSLSDEFNLLESVYIPGQLLRNHTLSEIRERIWG